MKDFLGRALVPFASEKLSGRSPSGRSISSEELQADKSEIIKEYDRLVKSQRPAGKTKRNSL